MNELQSYGVIGNAVLNSFDKSVSHRYPTTTTSTKFVNAWSDVPKTQIIEDEASQDVIFRLIVDGVNSTIDISSWKTVDFQTAINSIVSQKDSIIRKLKDITSWQKHRLDYQAVYTAYLLGSIEEEEFIEEADKFASNYKSIEPAKIAIEIESYSKLLDFKLTASDYSDFFSVDLMTVIQATSLLSSEVRESINTFHASVPSYSVE